MNRLQLELVYMNAMAMEQISNTARLVIEGEMIETPDDVWVRERHADACECCNQAKLRVHEALEALVNSRIAC